MRLFNWYLTEVNSVTAGVCQPQIRRNVILLPKQPAWIVQCRIYISALTPVIIYADLILRLSCSALLAAHLCVDRGLEF